MSSESRLRQALRFARDTDAGATAHFFAGKCDSSAWIATHGQKMTKALSQIDVPGSTPISIVPSLPRMPSLEFSTRGVLALFEQGGEYSTGAIMAETANDGANT